MINYVLLTNPLQCITCQNYKTGLATQGGGGLFPGRAPPLFQARNVPAHTRIVPLKKPTGPVPLECISGLCPQNATCAYRARVNSRFKTKNTNERQDEA